MIKILNKRDLNKRLKTKSIVIPQTLKKGDIIYIVSTSKYWQGFSHFNAEFVNAEGKWFNFLHYGYECAILLSDIENKKNIIYK